MADLHCELSWDSGAAGLWPAPGPTQGEHLASVLVNLDHEGLRVSCALPHWRSFRATLDHAVQFLLYRGQRPRLSPNTCATWALRDSLAGTYIEEEGEGENEGALLDECTWAFLEEDAHADEAGAGRCGQKEKREYSDAFFSCA